MPRRASKLREEFMAVYGPNKTLGQISKEIGRKYESVRRTHLNLGGDTSFPLSHTRLLRPKTESAIAQLLAIYSPDKSLSQIAKELDMPYHTVTYLIRKVSRVNDLPISQKRGLTEMFKDVWSPERNISSVAREIGCSRQQAYDIYSRLIRKGEISPRITALERDENAFVEAWSHEQDVEKVSAIIGKGYAIALQICRKLAREGEITLPLRQCANPKCYNSVQSAGKLKIYCSNKCAQERKNLRRKSNYISEPRTLWRQELKNALRFVDPGRKFITITESTLLSKLSKIVVVDLGKAGLVQTIDHPTKKWRGKPVRLYSRVHIVLAGEIHAKHNKRE
jgi:transposase-like protein